jgi:hypothetical protein
MAMRKAESTPNHCIDYFGGLNSDIGVTNNNIGNGAFGSDSHIS